MYRIISIFVFISFSLTLSSQEINNDTPYSQGNQGKFYAYWGWNWGWFSHSDIHLKGSNYDFTIHDVVAKDRQTKFDLGTYFGPTTVTIPQYNFRFGYYITDHYSISIASDHMKYVLQKDQVANITGTISESGTPFDGIYNNTPTILSTDLIQFEHTDGLNYGNIEVRRHDRLFGLGKIKVNTLAGVGAGILLPRTNANVLSKDRWDEFHLSGYGMSGVVGLNFAIGKRFFAQSEFKGGYINMPDIRTTNSNTDSASQDFFFYQLNIVFGATFGKGKSE